MNETRELQFALIGAQKCATSWLYYCLRDHPEICVPETKLEAGYIGGSLFNSKGEDWFFERFKPSAGQRFGDVSVEYLFDTSTVEELHQYCAPDAQLILSLRSPIDRMVSGYFWLIRRGKLENLPVEQGLEPILFEPQGFPHRIDGPLEEIVRRSCYGPQISTFAKRFGSNSMFVLLYEDIARNDLEQIQKLYRFLDVDGNFVPPSLSAKPKRNAHSSLLLKIENRFPRNKLIAKLVNYSNQAIVKASGGPKSDILPRQMRQKLEDLFAPTIDETLREISKLPEGQRPSTDHIKRSWLAPVK